MPKPMQKTVSPDGFELAYAEWNSSKRGQGPTLFFTHATGFHGRVWDQVVAALPDWHIISADQRGHGRSQGGEISDWRELGLDLAALVSALELEDIVGIGHSAGAHAWVPATAILKQCVSHLVLFDPVILRPEIYGPGKSLFPAGKVHPAAKRQRHFESVEAMADKLASRRPYSLFTPEVFSDYVSHATKPLARGSGVELACAPEIEANIYATALTNARVFEDIKSITQSVLIVRAKSVEGGPAKDFAASPTWPKLSEMFPSARDLQSDDWTHFLPMQNPERVASLIFEACSAKL